MTVPPLDRSVKDRLDGGLKAIERITDADAISIYGSLNWGADTSLLQAVESFKARRPRLVVVLTTAGGLVEVVERMVDILRHHYPEIRYFVPNMAMSAGTVMVMSGDSIHMDYYSRLGPIDPQVQKEGKMVPAMAYLAQFDALIKRSEEGTLTDAEFALLNKFDLAELQLFEQARELSVTLLRGWLATYKFKNWKETETHKTPVTQEMREARAEEIARALGEHTRWHSHSRGISRETLESELNLKIDDFGANTKLVSALRGYADLLHDYMTRNNAEAWIHARHYW